MPRSAPAESGKGCAIGYAIGMVGYLLGLIVSSLFDLPTGAVIVCALVTHARALKAARERDQDRERSNCSAQQLIASQP